MNNITARSLTQSSYPTLHQAEKKVADCILSHTYEIANCNVTELSEKSYASEATTVHTCKKLGYQGYYHLKIASAKKVINPDSSYSDNVDFTDTTSLATFLLKKQIENLIQSMQFFNAEVPKSIFRLLADCDIISFFAAGDSNPLAVYSAYKFNQLGLKTVVHVSSEIRTNAAYSMGKHDLAIDISNSGSTNLIVDIFKVVKERGAKSVCVTNYIKSPLSKLSTHQLNTAVSDKIFLEAFDSTRAPAMGIIDMLVLLFMYKGKTHYKKYCTRGEFFGSRPKG